MKPVAPESAGAHMLALQASSPVLLDRVTVLLDEVLELRQFGKSGFGPRLGGSRMTRRILFVVGLVAAMASAAHAQSHPTYASPQSGMNGPIAQSSQTYGPPQGMQPGMYGPPQGMYPSGMPQGGMYPGMMPPGGTYPDMMGPSGMGPSGMGPSGDARPGSYRMAAGPPPQKLPRGVTAENGLLYYNGAPYADNGYQQFNPYQQVAYQAGADGGMQPGGPQSVMSPGGNGEMGGYGDMNGNGQMPYGNYGCQQGNCGCQQGYCQQGFGGCQPGCDDGNCGDRLWCALFGHGGGFPGKYGYMWTAGVEALAWHRDAGTNRLLIQDTDTLAPIFSSNQFSFDFTAGGRVHLNLMGPSGIQYQGVYMKMGDWVTNNDILGSNNLRLPGDIATDPNLPDFFGADEMVYHYVSGLQSAEFNVIYPFGNFQFLAGYRYIELDETLGLTSFDLDTGSFGTFDTTVFNQMHGGQIGILGQWELFGLINFDFDAKFGIFSDFVHQHQVINDLGLTFRDTTGHENTAAYVTELGLVGVVPLGPTFSIRCGYNVMFIDRVALAPDQMDFTNTTDSGSSAQQKNDLVVQGVVLGIDARW